MKRFARRTALIALVWLTAASTLLAGLPRFECVCPGKQRQSVSGATKGHATCCCGGCCAAEPNEHEGHHDCCRHSKAEPSSHDPAPSMDAPGRAELTQPSCARTFILADSLSVVVTQPSSPTPSPDLSVLAPADLAVPPAPGTSCSRLLWLTSRLPPPTDLIVTLQHFVI